MSSLRRRVLNKLAQTTTTTPPLPPIPSVNASEMYPNINAGYDPARIIIINNIVRMLNGATHIATNGKYNLRTLKDNNFAFGDSEFTSPVKDILIFFRQVFIQLLNRGQNFPKLLTSTEINTKVEALLASPELQKFSQINSAGMIGKNISGNLQQDIRDELMRLRPATVMTPR